MSGIVYRELAMRWWDPAAVPPGASQRLPGRHALHSVDRAQVEESEGVSGRYLNTRGLCALLELPFKLAFSVATPTLKFGDGCHVSSIAAFAIVGSRIADLNVPSR